MKGLFDSVNRYGNKDFRDHFGLDDEAQAPEAPEKVTVGKKAAGLFESGYMCTESVLRAVCKEMGVRSKYIPRIATGMCAGMSRSCQTCGAISGAVMAIGIAAGRDKPGDDPTPAYAMTQELVHWFTKRFTSINCRELIGCDLGTDEGQAYFKQHELKHAICFMLTEQAADKALEIINDYKEGRVPRLRRPKAKPGKK
jgi:C_GCAxxG_C_C family probable redox protein